jgi:hypothetical protein
MPVIHGQKEHVDWTGRVELPGVHTFRVDLRLHEIELFRIRCLWQQHAAG